MSVHRQTLERIGMRASVELDRGLARANDLDTDALLAGVGRRRRDANVRRGVAVAAFASATLAVLFFVLGALRPAPVVVSTAAAAPSVGATVQPKPGSSETDKREQLTHLFVDGSEVTLRHETKAELRSVSEHGGTFALTHGTLGVHVVHHDESRWDVLAGSFDVRVTGTRFDATWDPQTKELTVAMTEGSVRVTGPCVDEPLAAPNTKTFSCPAAASASVDSLPSVPAPDVETAPKLMEKADAARLANDSANARRLYARIRERFPKSTEAAKATFLLGRLAESAGSADEALKWYETVVRETPRDAYAQEALGRTLALEQGRGNGERARSLAAEYLRKHPNGPYRAYATSVLDSR